MPALVGALRAALLKIVVVLPPSGNWALAANLWNDTGVWDDAASWMD